MLLPCLTPSGGHESLHLQLISEEQQQPLSTASGGANACNHTHAPNLMGTFYMVTLWAVMNSKGAPVVRME